MTDILVSEVGPRDGLQSIDRVLPLEAKKRWIAAEAVSYTHLTLPTIYSV